MIVPFPTSMASSTSSLILLTGCFRSEGIIIVDKGEIQSFLDVVVVVEWLGAGVGARFFVIVRANNGIACDWAMLRQHFQMLVNSIPNVKCDASLMAVLILH